MKKEEAPPTDNGTATANEPPPCATIYVKEKTFLCRWGDDDESAACRVRCKPLHLPRNPPRRSESPPPEDSVESAGKYLQASVRSGIQLGSVLLAPVKLDIAGSSTSDKNDTGFGQSDEAMAFSDILKGLENQSSSEEEEDGKTSKPRRVKIAYCIRREGCGACRMHALTLSELSKTMDFDMIGIMKCPRNAKTAGNEAGKKAIFDFYTQYFSFPLFRDINWDVYKFLGDRKLSNATFLSKVPKLVRLFAQKNIENVIFDGGRDIYTQGGILLFDAESKLRYVYYDRYGDELDMESLKLAIEDCQQLASTTRSLGQGKRLGVASRLPTRRGPNS